jgi:NADPH:quinone reductase-like Zn-dependent oxidoreductase
MRAVVYRRYGGPEVLEYTDVPDPKLSQNSVLVRIRAAALNPADHMLQAGLGESYTDAWFPVIPGWDVAGVVEQVGAGVSEFASGDEVIGFIRQEILHHGAYAELVSAPAETLARKPRTASWPEAAGLPTGGSHGLPCDRPDPEGRARRDRPHPWRVRRRRGGGGAVGAREGSPRHRCRFGGAP